MSITKKDFGDGFSLYTIENKNGVKVSVSDLGATVQSIFTPDRNGVLADIVLGYDTAAEYLSHGDYLGATIGRYANRIGGAKFSLDGVEYSITANEGKNVLHGGNGFDKKKFDVDHMDVDTIIFKLLSPDGDEGFPGELELRVLFRLNDADELQIIYSASSDKDTVVNFTNHSYFNLKGAGSGTILGHEIMINADRYTPVDAGLIPTGELREVAGTEFDLRTMRKIENGFYDHNFVLNGNHCAEAYDPESGRCLSVATDLPGVQFYCAGSLTERVGKGGAKYGKNHAFCLETQFFPDTPNKPDFPSCLLKKGDTFMTKTVYKFGVR